MADVTATALVWPSGNDVFGGGVAGDGKNVLEERFIKILQLLQNHRISGLALSAGAGLTLNVAAGEAMLRSQWLDVDAASFSLTDAATNHVYLKLTLDVNSRVSSVKFEHNTTGTPPSDPHVKLGTAVTSGGAITSTTHAGRTGRIVRRIPQLQVFTANDTFTPDDDVTEVYVEAHAPGGGGGGGDSTVNAKGGPGGPGGFAAGVVTVTPGVGITVTVPAGGAAGGLGANGGNASAASFGSSVVASGGLGGTAGGSTAGLDGRMGAPGAGTAGALQKTGGGAAGGRGGDGGGSGGTTAGGPGRVAVYF